MLSNIPDYILMKKAGELDSFFIPNGEYSEWDYELELRIPDDTKFYFGNCAGKVIFVPVEILDTTGNPIFSEIVGQDDEVIVYD